MLTPAFRMVKSSTTFCGWKYFLLFALLAGLILVYLTYLKRISFISIYSDISNLSQEDPRLVKYLRQKVIQPPSGESYNLSNSRIKDHSEFGQGTFVKEYFNNMRFGIFIEAGAYDGEFISNTLMLERELEWTGLLIEPNPEIFRNLSSKHRKAYTTNSCISLTTSSSEIEISLQGPTSQIVKKSQPTEKIRTSKVRCYPLYSFIAALKKTTIDLVSLDLEGVELEVLKTIPWEVVNVKSFLIEYFFIPEGKDFLKKFLAEKNYTLEKEFRYDLFFVKKD